MKQIVIQTDTSKIVQVPYTVLVLVEANTCYLEQAESTVYMGNVHCICFLHIQDNVFYNEYKMKHKTDISTHLKSDFDLLGESALWELCLHLRYNGGAEHAALAPHKARLGTDPRHDGEVLREVRGDDAGDASLVQLLRSLQVYKHITRST